MNFDDLKNFEIYLNNPSRFIKDCNHYVNQNLVVAANSLIVLLGFCVIVFLTTKNFNQYQSLASRKKILQSKRQPIQDLEQSNKYLTDYMRKMPLGLVKADFISYVTGRATRRRITIDAFNPLQTSNDGFFRSTRMSFSASSFNIRDMLLFIHDMESSGYMIKLDSLFIRHNAVSNALNSGGQTGAMTLDVTISLLQLVEDNDSKISKNK